MSRKLIQGTLFLMVPPRKLDWRDFLVVARLLAAAGRGAARGAHAAVIPGYHLKRHWNTVIIDGSLPDEAIRDMVEDSYVLVVNKLPKSRRRALGWRGDP
jgi:hypothetical protein